MNFVINVPDHIREKNWIEALRMGFPEVVWSDDLHGRAEINLGSGDPVEVIVEVKDFEVHVDVSESPIAGNIKKVSETRVNMAFAALAFGE